MAALALPLITAGANLIGGIFGANSAKKAAKQIKQGSDVVANDIGRATGVANTAINEAANRGTARVDTATQAGQATNTAAQEAATANVNARTGEANTVLGTNLASQQQGLSSYLATGAAGNEALQKQIANPFALPSAADVEKTPGYQFQLAQGTRAIGQSAAAAGASQTSGTLKSLAQYGQGLASTYYQNASQNALSAYTTNTNTAMAGVNTGLTGTGMFNQATQNASNQQAGNVLRAGYYAGDTGLDTARYNSDLGFRGATTGATFDIGAAGAEAANTINSSLNAGNVRMQGYGAQAAGTIGATNAWTGAISGAGNALANGYYARPNANPNYNQGAPPSRIPWGAFTGPMQPQ